MPAMRLIKLLGLLCALVVFAGGAEALQPTAPGKQTAYQVSTLQALMEGCYDRVVTAGELRQQGNFGIGTFENLDGEMVVLNGEVWQVRSTGEINKMPDSAGIPFANVSNGALPSACQAANASCAKQVGALADFDSNAAMQKQFDSIITNRNLPHLIIAEGEFTKVQTRSVPAQSKPYPRLAEAVKNQVVFNAEKTKGVLVGFWLPEYVKGINMPGFHLHFLADDRRFGGHVLDCAAAGGVRYAVFPLADFQMKLPASGDFSAKNISLDKAEELRKIEGK